MAEEKPNHYAIIPAGVRYDTRLNANEKLLYGEIRALVNEHDYCDITNQYFADLYRVKRSTVSRWIADLQEAGYVRTELIYKDGTEQILKRRIYLLVDGATDSEGE